MGEDGDTNKGQDDLMERITNVACSSIDEWGLTIADVVGVLHCVAFNIQKAVDQIKDEGEDKL